ncbi:g3990 [Coccomyxa elongata]
MLDPASPPGQTTLGYWTGLRHVETDHSLYDVWRDLNSDRRTFTHIATSGQSAARLDRWLISEQLRARVSKEPHAIGHVIGYPGDHLGVSLSLTASASTLYGAAVWRREGVSMLSRAGNGPGGKCAAPSRHEPKVAVALLWQRLRRLCLVKGPAAGCGLLAVAEAVGGRAAAAASRATGSSRPHKRMDPAVPAAAYPAPEKGCPPPLPWTPSGPRWHGDRCADRLCCQPRWEGAWGQRRRRCHGSGSAASKVWMRCRKEASCGAGPCTKLRKSLILTRPCRVQSSQANGRLSASLSCLLKHRGSLIVAWKLRVSGCMRRWGCSCWYDSTYLRTRGGAWSREASNVEKSRYLPSCQMCW